MEHLWFKTAGLRAAGLLGLALIGALALAPVSTVLAAGQAKRPLQEMRALKGGGAKPRRTAASPEAKLIAWRAAVADQPGSAAAHLGLARALALRGQCAEALVHFRPWAGTATFTRDVALAAAQCAAQAGEAEEAVAFDRAALAEEPDNVRLLTALALHSDMAGDGPGLAQALWALETAGANGGDPSVSARAMIALRHGDVGGFDLCRSLWRRAGWTEGQLFPLEAALWLDLDDPVAAVQSVDPAWDTARLKKSGGQAIYVEAQRRLGEAALWMLGSSQEATIQSASIRARLLTDQGELEAAAEILAALPDDPDPDLVASRWYLARARQDSAALEARAAQWAAINRSPLRTLDQLVPLPAR